ncbi:MAG: periplasmic heavy metal sensor [Octadecabacter sp.]|nr:periplasmic heavy metal sensor [Octadecabacter sp.]
MAEKQKKKGRLQRGLLIASLALNLLVVGVVAGAVFNGGGPGGPQRIDLTVGPLTRAMDGERRDAVRDALRESGAFQRRDRSAIREDMQVLLATLRADVFDEAAFREALSRQRARLQSGQSAVLEAVTAQIEDMGPEERAAFADRLEAQARRGPAARRQSD